MTNTMLLWYWATSLILGVGLFFPIRNFISAMITNKFQRKEKRAVTDTETKRIRKRGGMIAAIISITFAFLFNGILISRYYMGGQ